MTTDRRPGTSRKKQGDSTFFPQQHPLTVKRKPSGNKGGRGK
jgi:hypothetical protein